MSNLPAFTILAAIASAAAIAPADPVIVQGPELEAAISEIGAELQSIRHPATGTEFLWQGDPAFWAGRSPNMFPVVVRFKEHRFTYRGAPYEMPFLGLAHTARFEVVERDEGSAKLAFRSSPETMRHYPFPFRMEIVFAIDGRTLVQTYTISNTGAETLRFALGGHPGIRAPFGNGRARGDYEIRFSQPLDTDREIVSGGLLTGRRVAYLQGEDRLPLDDPRVPESGMLLKGHASRKISLALAGQPPYATVDIGDFPNTNLWTPPGMPFVCIEPLVGHHDSEAANEAIEKKDSLESLPAGESRAYRFSIIIDPEEGAKALR